MLSIAQPVDLQEALVRKLRAIPALVMEMNGQQDRIQPYFDVYPQNVNLAAALYQMDAPSLIVTWQGITPARFGATEQWSHQLTLWWRSGGDVDDPRRSMGRIVSAIFTGIVTGTGHPLIGQAPDSWVAGSFFECPQLFPVQRQQNAEGIDIWECPILLQQYH